MLYTEKLEASKIAYDRPSNKLLNFLQKNFNLVDYVPQNNNFVVYNDYFGSSNFNILKNKKSEPDVTNFYLYSQWKSSSDNRGILILKR
jgi:alpha-tubulin N-acetyltransferase 1